MVIKKQFENPNNIYEINYSLCNRIDGSNLSMKLTFMN